MVNFINSKHFTLSLKPLAGWCWLHVCGEAGVLSVQVGGVIVEVDY